MITWQVLHGTRLAPNCLSPFQNLVANKLYQDKAMMARWGLEGMGSFTQERVASKELPRPSAADQSASMSK